MEVSKGFVQKNNYNSKLYNRMEKSIFHKPDKLEQNKVKTTTKIKNLIKDKKILLEKIKNLSEQLDKVILMLQETTSQKTSQEEEISELTKKLKLSENQIFELTQKNKIIQTEQNQINIEIKSEYKTKLEEYKNQIDNLNQIIKEKNRYL